MHLSPLAADAPVAPSTVTPQRADFKWETAAHARCGCTAAMRWPKSCRRGTGRPPKACRCELLRAQGDEGKAALLAPCLRRRGADCLPAPVSEGQFSEVSGHAFPRIPPRKTGTSIRSALRFSPRREIARFQNSDDLVGAAVPDRRPDMAGLGETSDDAPRPVVDIDRLHLLAGYRRTPRGAVGNPTSSPAS